MPLSLKIALRYLFSKKSHSSINAISAVSVCGVALATVAMICTLSVYNGFQGVVVSLYSDLDPQIEIKPKEGKTMDMDKGNIPHLYQIKEISNVTPIIEDDALVVFGNRQVPVTLKGVPPEYADVSGLERVLVDGNVLFADTVLSYAVVGSEIAGDLLIRSGNVLPMLLYAPRRTSKVSLVDPSSSFNKETVFCSGVFSINQPSYDDKIIFIPINVAREIFEYPTEVTSIELKLLPSAKVDNVKKHVADLLGDGFTVKDRMEQQSAAFSMMKIEKWITFEILSFVLLIAAFNIIGSVSMLIIYKRDDIKTFYNMGASQRFVDRVFFLQGCTISAIGAILGVFLGLVLSLVQEHYGLLKMGEAFIVESYPVNVIWTDILAVIIVVMLIGVIVARYPIRYINRVALAQK